MISEVNVKLRPGTGSDLADAGGSLFTDGTDRNDSAGGGVETTLATYTVKANTLNVIGASLEIGGSGVAFGRSLDQQLRFYVDATTPLAILRTPAADLYWQFFIVLVVKTIGASGVLKYRSRFYDFANNSAATTTRLRNGSVNVNLTADFIVKFTNQVTGTVTDTATTQYDMLCDFIPSQ